MSKSNKIMKKSSSNELLHHIIVPWESAHAYLWVFAMKKNENYG